MYHHRCRRVGNSIRGKSVVIHCAHRRQPNLGGRILMLILSVEIQTEVATLACNPHIPRLVWRKPRNRRARNSAELQSVLIPRHRRDEIRQCLVARDRHWYRKLAPRVDLRASNAYGNRRWLPRIRVRENHIADHRSRQGNLVRESVLVLGRHWRNRHRSLADRVVFLRIEPQRNRRRHHAVVLKRARAQLQKRGVVCKRHLQRGQFLGRRYRQHHVELALGLDRNIAKAYRHNRRDERMCIMNQDR